MGKRKKISQILFDFNISCLYSFSLAAELRPEAGTTCLAKNGTWRPKMKELIFHMAPREKINLFYSDLGYLCSVQVGFAAQKLHIYVLLQFSSKAGNSDH